MHPDEVKRLIEQGLPDATVVVRSADQTHFEALVVSAAFAGKRSVQRHQMIYRALGPSMGDAIHALSIRACTPEEYTAGGGD